MVKTVKKTHHQERDTTELEKQLKTQKKLKKENIRLKSILANEIGFLVIVPIVPLK